MLEDLDVLDGSRSAPLNLGAGSEVAGGEDLLAGQVLPGQQGLGQGPHRVIRPQLMQGQAKAYRVDLGHTAGQASNTCLLVNLVTVGSVDTLIFRAIPYVGIH